MRDTGGVLLVELTQVDVTDSKDLAIHLCKPGSYLKLEVKDTGHGMSKETLEKIFDPYFSTKQPDQGTGLGLAVVNGIVKKHHGFIKAYSEIGQGSSFQIFWPVVDIQSPSNIDDKETPDPVQGTEKIMLVDDEEHILKVSQLILEKQGYSVSIFKDGVSAYKAFCDNPQAFSLIVTDMAMPRMTGSELSLKILNIRKNIPIILCTGYSENFDEDMAMEIGIKKYVQKPIPGQELAVHIRELLDN
jgi:CheY-like chemotaxis protein